MPRTSAPPHPARNAQVLVAVIVAGAALHWLAPILTPLALALFLMVMIDGLARVLRSRLPGLGASAALPAAIVVCILAFGVTVYIVAGNAAAFVGRLVSYEPRLNLLLEQLGHTLHGGVPSTVSQLVSMIDPAKFVPMVAGWVQTLASTSVFVLVYLGFMLASRHGFERKAVRIFHGRAERHEALNAFLRVRDALEQYVSIQTVCGGIIALGSWAMMMVMGLESALFWAFLIFVLGYIPIIGAAIGIIGPVLFALVQFPTIWPAAILLAGLFTLTFLVGNILLPRMQGRGLNLDPVLVLFSLGFWGALWGATGMFLSTPLTVLAMVILAQFDGSLWIAVLLSGDGDPRGLGHSAHPNGAPQPSRKREAAALSG
ncbi:MAG: AI-2E family transporter [Caulobacteraceae bacterium]|nr:AI-2E family transporter [Caulobacteraceae bacterium]